jgi:hypothetical protein
MSLRGATLVATKQSRKVIRNRLLHVLTGFQAVFSTIFKLPWVFKTQTKIITELFSFVDGFYNRFFAKV